MHVYSSSDYVLVHCCEVGWTEFFSRGRDAQLPKQKVVNYIQKPIKKQHTTLMIVYI